MTRLAEFFTPVVKKDMFVTSNMEVDPMITLNMDIVFPNCPCGSKYLIIEILTALLSFSRLLTNHCLSFCIYTVLDFKFQTGYSTWAR